MGKLIFKPIDVIDLTKKVEVKVPELLKKKKPSGERVMVDEEGQPVEIYTGPSKQEIETEILRIRKEAEGESESIIQEGRNEADKIIKQAEEGAFKRVKEASAKIKSIESEAQKKAETILSEAEDKAAKVLTETKAKVETIEAGARVKGYEEGNNKGYEEGQKEVKRLIERLGGIIGGAIDKRKEIIESAEKQLVELVLQITRKVIKDETRERKEIVLNNIREALGRIEDKESVVIRVNLSDLEITTAHREEFISMVEGLKKVKVMEDSRIDKGGCIVEFDYGSVDARIATQLEEIEEKVRDISPL